MTMAIGITAEYNPFHLGHLHHVRQTRLAGGDVPLVAVMSGSFTQRGEPTLTDKWTRTKMALACGIDVVLELPTVFVCRSAEFFAAGAMQVLTATGVLDAISCGAETANAELFTATARFLNTADAQAQLHAALQTGLSYPAAVAHILHAASLLTPRLPNDILALEYCRQLLRLPDAPRLLCIPRQGDYHDTVLRSGISGASALRLHWAEHGLDDALAQSVPSAVWAILQEAHAQCNLGADLGLFSRLVLYQLRALSAEQIAASCQCSEGLEHRLKSAAACADYEDAVRCAAAKRYPLTRLRRLLLQLLLQQPRAVFESAAPQYLRVLGFTARGQKLLHTMRRTARLPLITNLSQALTRQYPQLAVDVAAANLRALVQPDAANAYNRDYRQAPVRL